MPAQRAVERIDVSLAVAEDQRVLDRLPAQEPAQRALLVGLRRRDEALLHEIGRRGRRRHRDFLRRGQKLVGQPANLRRHGGREHQRLPALRNQPDDPFDIGDKSHVEHPVGFVDNEYLDAGEQNAAAFEQVEHPPRRGDQDVDAAFQRLALIGHGDAADKQRLGEAAILAVNREIPGNLRRQFARRREDQRSRHPRAGAPRAQYVDHRQGERSRFPRARLGASHHVAALQHDGYRLRLDRRGFAVAGVGDRAKRFGGQAQFVEFHAIAGSVGGGRPAAATIGVSRRKRNRAAARGKNRAKPAPARNILLVFGVPLPYGRLAFSPRGRCA